MYIKKILVAIALMGLIFAGIFAYYVYQAVFTPNTNFETKNTVVYIPSEAKYQDVLNTMKPIVKDIHSFDRIAKRKGYPDWIKPGRYIISKGLNNNEIVNVSSADLDLIPHILLLNNLV